MDRIVIDDLHFWGVHGVYPQERLQKQEFIVSVKIYLDLSRASCSDALEDTFNYAELVPQLKSIVEEKSFFLLERLAGELINCIFSFNFVKKAKVAVTKAKAQVNDYSFAPTVVLERER